MKKLWVLCLIFALLVGCGGQRAEESAAPDTMDSTEAVAETDSDIPPYFKAEFLPAENHLQDAYDFLVWEDRLLCCGMGSGSQWSYRTLYWSDFQGETREDIPVTLGENEGISGMAVDEQGNIYLILSTYTPDAHDEENGIAAGYLAHHMVILDQQGTVLSDFPLTAEDAHLTEVVVATSGEIYIIRAEYDAEKGYFGAHYIDRYSPEGALSETIATAERFGEGAILDGLLTAQDGTLLVDVQFSNSSCDALYPLKQENADNNSLFEPLEDMVWPTFYSGTSADYYVHDENKGFYACSLTSEPTFLFKTSELPGTIPENSQMVAELGAYTYLFRTYLDNAPYFFTVTGQWQPVEETEAIKLVIGSYSETLNGSLMQKVTLYNLLHEDVELELRVYSVDDEKGYIEADEANQLLQKDILNGDGPDILILDNWGFLPETYGDNGFLTDLTGLMEGDETFRQEDYFSNLWVAGEHGLSYLTVTFNLRTMVTSAALTENGGWLPSQALELVRSTGLPFVGYADSLKEYVQGDGLTDYIDGETCHFDDGEFAALLELTQFFDNEAGNTDFRLREQLVFAELMYINYVSDLCFMDAQYGDYWLKGVPSTEMAAISVNVDKAVGIAETCENKAAAWDVVKHLMHSTNSLFGSGFSVLRSELDENIAAAMLPKEDENSTLSHTGYNVGGIDLEGTPLTQEQADMLIGAIESAKIEFVSVDIRAIAEEECAAFFAGDKTAEEVAALIQNRVSICLAE